MKTKLLFVFAFLAFQFSFAKTLTIVDPVAPGLSPLTYCDQNNDGFGVFDLMVQNAAILAAQTGSSSDYAITYHETLTQANTGSSSISSPYFNINPLSQTVYYRVRNVNTNLFAVGTFQLVVNPTPVATIPNDYHLCDYTGAVGYESFDLTTVIPEVLGSINPFGSSVSFYTNQANAESGTNQITNVGNYVNSTLGQQTLYVRVAVTATGCYDVVPLHLVVDPLPQSTQPNYPEYAICDYSAPTGFESFDLSTRTTSILLGQTGMYVTFFPSLADAQNNTNAIINYIYTNQFIYVQTLGIRITNASTGCYVISIMDIRVLPIPTPNTNPPALAPKCDENNPGDMMEVFDLTVNEAYMVNGDPNLTFHYFETMMDAENNTNAILTPTAALVGGNVWIRVENNRIDYQGNHCYVLVEQALTVNPLPTIVQPLPPYRVCDDDADGIATFDLTNTFLAQMILGPSLLPTNYTVSYYLSAANAASGTAPLPSFYTNVAPNIQDVYIRVVNNATGCVNTDILTLGVETGATATGPQSFADCDSYADPFDGIGAVDLTQFAPAILNGQNPAVFLLSYYTTLADAIAGTNALTQTQATSYETDPDTDTIWVKVENGSNSITPLCYAITTIDINVQRYPNPIIYTDNGFNTVYVDGSNNVVQSVLLDSGVTGNYSFQWYLNGSPIAGATSSTYLVNTATPNNESRSYSVNAENNSSLGCSAQSSDFVVLQSDVVPPPAGLVNQSLPAGSTLANIVVSGSNIQWYAAASNKNTTATNSTPLPLNTVLVDGTTYYASQTVGGIESIDRLPVTVHLALGVDENDIFPIQYAPNPVKNSLTLQSTSILKSVMVYTMLGQKVFEQDCNNTNLTIDLSRLSAGNYILKAQGETGQKTIRIIKE